MRELLYTVMIWPVDHLWESLLLAIPGGVVSRYGFDFIRSDHRRLSRR